MNRRILFGIGIFLLFLMIVPLALYSPDYLLTFSFILASQAEDILDSGEGIGKAARYI